MEFEVVGEGEEVYKDWLDGIWEDGFGGAASLSQVVVGEACFHGGYDRNPGPDLVSDERCGLQAGVGEHLPVHLWAGVRKEDGVGERSMGIWEGVACF